MVLKFLILLYLKLCFVSEVWRAIGACTLGLVGTWYWLLLPLLFCLPGKYLGHCILNPAKQLLLPFIPSGAQVWQGAEWACILWAWSSWSGPWVLQRSALSTPVSQCLKDYTRANKNNHCQGRDCWRKERSFFYALWTSDPTFSFYILLANKVPCIVLALTVLGFVYIDLSRSLFPVIILCHNGYFVISIHILR